MPRDGRGADVHTNRGRATRRVAIVLVGVAMTASLTGLPGAVSVSVAAMAVPAAQTPAAITIPVGEEAVLSGAQFSACDSLAYGYTVGGGPNQQLDAKTSTTCTNNIPAAGATVGPVPSAETLLIYLTDTFCSTQESQSVTYYSDGTGTANHASVSGSNPYTVQLADGGDLCTEWNTTRDPTQQIADNLQVSVQIVPAGPPACESAAISTPAGGGAVTIALSCSPIAAQPSYAIVAPPAHGTLGAITQATGQVTYTPASGYYGPDSFHFTATDSGGVSTPATISVTVPPAAPVCQDVMAGSTAGAPASVPLACSGPPGVPISYAIVAGPAHGRVSAPSASGQAVYTPNFGFVGTDSFTYDATDTSGASNLASASVTVGPPPATTGVRIQCSPQILPAQQTTTCTATVTSAPNSAGGAATGTIAFTSAEGRFNTGGSCALDAGAACSAVFTANGTGTIPISAAYSGDTTHLASSGFTTVATEPVAGRTATATAPAGRVLIKQGRRYVLLKGTIAVRLGSTIDARSGSIRVVTAGDTLSATNPHHTLESATLSAGMFTVRQQLGRHRRPATRLGLVTPPHPLARASCTRSPGAKGVVRSLNGLVKGAYQVVGVASTLNIEHGSFAVQDRCDGTLTHVIRGHATVTVTHGRLRNHTIALGPGQTYLARSEFFAVKQGGR